MSVKQKEPLRSWSSAAESVGQEQLLRYDSLGYRIRTSFLLYSPNLRGNCVIQGAPKFHCFQVLVSQEETYA